MTELSSGTAQCLSRADFILATVLPGIIPVDVVELAVCGE